MSGQINHLYWDACIFIAHLNEEREKHGNVIDDIQQFLEECRQGKCRIYTSAVTIAEIPSSALKKLEAKNFVDFLATYQGAIVQIGADPIVMQKAAELRSLPYSRGQGRRPLGTMDAIHLASALQLSEAYGVHLDAFHTLDNGKGRSGDEGRTVGLLSYESWCESCQTDLLAKRVIALARVKPQHPEPIMPMDLPLTPRPHASLQLVSNREDNSHEPGGDGSAANVTSIRGGTSSA